MPDLETSPAIYDAIVVDRREPASGIVVLGLHAPEIARDAKPGQFAMAVPPAGESVATALAIYEASGDRISLMIVVAGSRTRELANLRAGQKLSLLAPLGNGFDCDRLRGNVGFVAGGVGIATLLLLAQKLARRKDTVHLYYGARDADSLVDADRFAELGIGVSVATDDGSRGHRGFVTELVEREARSHDVFAACGPSSMLRSVGKIARRRGARAQLALEEAFGCGVGACWGCVVAIDPHSAQAPRFPLAPNVVEAGANGAVPHVYARVCKEGPAFWADELRW